MLVQTGLYINGKYVPSSTGETLTIYNPNDETLVSNRCQAANEVDVNKAVGAAKAAFQAWKNTSGLKHGAIMYKFADLLEEHRDRIAALEGQSMAQPLKTARNNLITAISIWRYYAGLASRILARVLFLMRMESIKSFNTNRSVSVPEFVHGTVATFRPPGRQPQLLRLETPLSSNPVKRHQLP
ncbi:uncharacterized protein APUU_10026S [Aspergillus puulaauensis]|uniref:Aldehyde dehydrogenase domain-containing protein n=1 Tax=Aspergillus puulaauensis TaxID=1220207 RepID=A0A7R8AH78_9EURO|nr:uncharacterized protein APUU_10026S [Aspergillus puulaauensis]BCS17198.1 hypothetical protein APUU_10026S [Aspergillus puulaauensis]